MKKYPISVFYRGVYAMGLVLLSLGIATFAPPTIRSIISRDIIWAGVLIIAVCLIGIFCTVYTMFFDVLARKYSLDKQQITVYIGKIRKNYKWSTFSEYGIVWSRVNGGSGRKYWVYCSPRALNYIEKINFLNRTRRKVPNIVYFQFDSDSFRELLEYIPKEWAERLKEQELSMLRQIRISK